MKKVYIGCGLLGASVAIVAGAAIINKNIKENNTKIEKSLDGFKFELNPVIKEKQDFKIEEHYASEFAHASFDVPSFEYEDEPATKNNSNYWDDIIYKYEHNAKNLFLLTNRKKNQSLEDFQNNYHFYFHSFANDFEGVLYFRMYYEEKTDGTFEKAGRKDLEERKPSWKFRDFKMEGFKNLSSEKKIREHKNDALKYYNPYDHSFQLKEKTMKHMFLTSHGLKADRKIESVDDFLDIENKKEGNLIFTEKVDSEEAIKKSHEAFLEFFSYDIESKRFRKDHVPYFYIDKERPIWATKTADDEVIELHYYVYRFIPDAKYGDGEDEQLNQSKKQVLEEEITVKLDIMHYKMKELSKFVRISKFIEDTGEKYYRDLFPTDLRLRSDSPSGDDSKHYTNYRTGWIQNLNLYFEEEGMPDELKKIKNECYLSYYRVGKDSVFNNFDKFKDKVTDENKDTPFIIQNNDEGKATIVYKIESKKTWEWFYGTIDLEGFNKHIYKTEELDELLTHLEASDLEIPDKEKYIPSEYDADQKIKLNKDSDFCKNHSDKVKIEVKKIDSNDKEGTIKVQIVLSEPFISNSRNKSKSNVEFELTGFKK